MKKAKHSTFKRSLYIVQKFFPKVDVVCDAHAPITIKVTTADDKSSRRREHDQCALAVACKRTRHVDGVIVSRTMAYLIKGRKATRYFVPMAAQKELVSFDRGGMFAPGVYKLETPQHLLGANGTSGTNGTHSRNGSTPKRAYHRTAEVRTVLGSKNA